VLKLTLPELENAQRDALVDLIDEAGTYSHLARMLGCNPMVVKGWVNRGRVSPNGALLIAKHPRFAERFPVSITRPDLESATDGSEGANE